MSFTAEIVTTLAPHLAVGAHACRTCPERALLLGREPWTWTFNVKSNGQYTLSLGEWVATPNDHENAVVLYQTEKPQLWNMVFSRDDPSIFSVVHPATNLAWSVVGNGPESAVELWPFDFNEPIEGQLFATSIQ